MFAATMIFTSLSDYLITKNSYLSSNNEMIALAMSNIFGKEYYVILHNALVETAEIYQITIHEIF